MSWRWWAPIRRPRLRPKSFTDRVRWQPCSEWARLQTREIDTCSRSYLPGTSVSGEFRADGQSYDAASEIHQARHTEAWVGSFLLSVQASHPSGKKNNRSHRTGRSGPEWSQSEVASDRHPKGSQQPKNLRAACRRTSEGLPEWHNLEPGDNPPTGANWLPTPDYRK